MADTDKEEMTMTNQLCVFCSGKREKREVRVDRRRGERLIVFDKVPAETCSDCGEVYFSQAVMEAMESYLKDTHFSPTETLEVPVVELKQAV